MDPDPIPKLLPPEDTSPLLTQAELHQHWRALMGELGFARRRLWLLFLDHDARPTPLVVQIDEVPENPRPRDVASLVQMCQQVRLEQGLAQVAVLISRPGEAAVRPSDRRWALELLAAARRTGLPLAPLHLANDERLVPLTGDDLLPVRSGSRLSRGR